MSAANFSINGLFSYYKNGYSISYCDSSNAFNSSKVSDLISRWKLGGQRFPAQVVRFGTCTDASAWVAIPP
uniref:Uncharacterized protein n=1 Tax=Nelumbo nucifera TaxID=4432 RepID=A0A822XXZ7_NELNU|nr:TPA_asm: hypothetical protein HUJ06_025544 [Nelumbo nucifera]